MSDEIQKSSLPTFTNRRFQNLEPVAIPRFKNILTWLITRKPTRWPKWVESQSQDLPKPSHNQGEILVTFVNHSTFIMQVDGLTILTDPIWSERCSPLSFVGPKRVRVPGIRFEDLPAVDIVTISHNHYDHLDLPTLKLLDQKSSPLIVAGLGTKKFLEKAGLKNVAELDWWQHTSHKNHQIHFVPAQHYSNRSLFDKNKMLWGGFVIESSRGNIYVGGDTGFGNFIHDIHTRFPSLALTLLPIGHYQARWFMKPVHMNPDDAVRAHKILGARQSVGMHYGTFPLSDEGIQTPAHDLREALKRHDVPAKEFLALDFGETIRV